MLGLGERAHHEGQRLVAAKLAFELGGHIGVEHRLLPLGAPRRDAGVDDALVEGVGS